jgi:hypothetical protein
MDTPNTYIYLFNISHLGKKYKDWRKWISILYDPLLQVMSNSWSMSKSLGILQQYFILIAAVNCIGRGNRRTRRKIPTLRN